MSSLQRRMSVCRAAGGCWGLLVGAGSAHRAQSQNGMGADRPLVKGSLAGEGKRSTPGSAPHGPPPRHPAPSPAQSSPPDADTLSVVTHTLLQPPVPLRRELPGMHTHLADSYTEHEARKSLEKEGVCNFTSFDPIGQINCSSKLNCQDSPKIQVKGKQRKGLCIFINVF